MTNRFDLDEKTLSADFARICDCGGRLSGTGSEAAATACLETLGRKATGAPVHAAEIAYEGWSALSWSLKGPGGNEHVCHPLVRTVGTLPEGLEAEVVDLGRGTPDEFEAHRNEIPGRIALVRHELMFAAGTIHRRKKYQAAIENGAIGFLIAGPLPGHPVAGSSGRGSGPGIPALGITPETATALARRSSGFASVRMAIDVEEKPATAQNLFFEMKGQTDEWVVLSAHIDGHDLAESAMDNASGLAVALAVARALAPGMAERRRGLRLAFFNVEEWALTGSESYVAGLLEAERLAIKLNVNLDSVAGGDHLTALTSNFAGLEPFLLEQSESCDVRLGLYRPHQMNSDHGNFANAGIPAFRLVAGFNDTNAATRLVLTPEDTRDKVTAEELAKAARLAWQITIAALDASPDRVSQWRLERVV